MTNKGATRATQISSHLFYFFFLEDIYTTNNIIILCFDFIMVPVNLIGKISDG